MLPYSAPLVLLYNYSRQIFRETYLLFSMFISMLKMRWTDGRQISSYSLRKINQKNCPISNVQPTFTMKEAVVQNKRDTVFNPIEFRKK